MKEKANYPNNNTNTNIDHFLAFRRKAKIIIFKFWTSKLALLDIFATIITW